MITAHHYTGNLSEYKRTANRTEIVRVLSQPVVKDFVPIQPSSGALTLFVCCLTLHVVGLYNSLNSTYSIINELKTCLSVFFLFLTRECYINFYHNKNIVWLWMYYLQMNSVRVQFRSVSRAGASIQRFCPHRSSLRFESWPGALCCVSLTLSLSQPVSCQIFICSFKEKLNAQKYILKIQQMNSVEPGENTLSSHLHSWRIIHPLINEYSFSNLV